MNCQRRSARPTRSAGAKPLRPAGWGQKVTFEKCKPLSCCCCCRIPIMVENVGLLIFLRESASATAVPGAQRSSATAVPTQNNKPHPARGVNFVIAIPPPHMRGLELHAPPKLWRSRPLIRDASATTSHTISAPLQCGRPCARNRVTHCANAELRNPKAIPKRVHIIIRHRHEPRVQERN